MIMAAVAALLWRWLVASEMLMAEICDKRHCPRVDIELPSRRTSNLMVNFSNQYFSIRFTFRTSVNFSLYSTIVSGIFPTHKKPLAISVNRKHSSSRTIVQVHQLQ